MFSRALNHMAVPSLRWDRFLDLAGRIGCVGVEFRNDLAGPLFDGDAPQAVAQAAKARGLRVLALAEVKSFNDWSDAKRSEAEALMQAAVACSAEAVSLIPRNDGLGCRDGERQANLRTALQELRPMLEAHALVGLVEPLGFQTCSLRSKAEAVAAIESLGAAGRFKLVHDTFHHALAGCESFFPDYTGIVHISGVPDATVAPGNMKDAHRGLVDAADRLGNIEQIEALRDGGYVGPVSLEPFSPEVHALADPELAIRTPMDFVAEQLAELAA